MTIQPETEVESVAALARSAAKPSELEAGRIYARANADGDIKFEDTDLKFEDTDRWAAKPRRVERVPLLTDAASFLRYLDRRGALGNSAALEVWADLTHLRFTAILDGKDGWRGDRATLELTESPEWAAWTVRSGALRSQLDFADFIEDNLGSIAEPDGAVLLEIVQSMQGRSKVEWKSAEWIANGARSFAWVEEVDAKAGKKGTLEIPAKFTLGLRPFIGSEPFKVTANLRYRITDGTLQIGFKLPDVGRIVEQAFNDVVAAVEAGVPVPVLRGRP